MVPELGMRPNCWSPVAVWRRARSRRSHEPDVLLNWMYYTDLIGGIADGIA